MVAAAIVVTPIGGGAAIPALVDPVAFGAGLGVGVASSVIPYVCDQLAMARMQRATYALLVSLLPATATVIGFVVLAQVPSWVEGLGVGLVIAGVAIYRGRTHDPRQRGTGAIANAVQNAMVGAELKRREGNPAAW